MTSDEREQIIAEITEQLLLKLPEVIGNLINNHLQMLKLNRDFYKRYSEFRDKKDIVASVIEMVEGQNTHADYETILKKAVPEIKKRIKDTDPLDLTTITKPSKANLTFDNGDL